jgi:uncharacterized protein (UPF0332 family)
MMQGEREIDYRNAGSRAYYGAFHACRMLLEKRPHSQASIGTSHQRVINGLLSDPNKQINSLGNKLARAKDFRQKADYQLNLKFSRYEAMRLFSLAQKIYDEVDDLLQSLKK